MKKFITIILIVLMLFALPACSTAKKEPAPTPTPAPQTPPTTPQAPAETPATTTYTDGTYTGEGDKREHGFEDSTVTIEGGKITKIVLRRLETNGKEVNYEDWTGKEVNGKKYPNLKQYRVDMANKMVEKQSPDVDTISGATESSKGWIEATKRALEKAVKK